MYIRSQLGKFINLDAVKTIDINDTGEMGAFVAWRIDAEYLDGGEEELALYVYEGYAQNVMLKLYEAAQNKKSLFSFPEDPELSGFTEKKPEEETTSGQAAPEHADEKAEPLDWKEPLAASCLDADYIYCYYPRGSKAQIITQGCKGVKDAGHWRYIYMELTDNEDRAHIFMVYDTGRRRTLGTYKLERIPRIYRDLRAKIEDKTDYIRLPRK